MDPNWNFFYHVRGERERERYIGKERESERMTWVDEKSFMNEKRERDREREIKSDGMREKEMGQRESERERERRN